MKRRVSTAVLFVLALLSLVGIGCGSGNRQDAETTKGKPFTAVGGVTRSVNAIVARQRFELLHPKSTAHTEEADAEGAASEEGGRNPSEAAAESVGAAIREKPEPGEEGGPPRRQGPAARQQRVGRAAITPSQAVTPDGSFLGAQSNESGFVPPDSMGSVGPSQVLVDVNGRLKVFDKQGNPGGLNVSDSAFWAPVRNGTEPTDPGVEYDRLSGRWIVSAINTASTNNRIMLAISNGPTISSTSDFTYFFFNEASPPPSAPAHFADYPQLGVDANAIYIGVNEFTSSSGSFAGTSAFVIRKSSVMGSGPLVVTAFRGLAGSSGPGITSPQPATDMDPNVGSGYIVGPDNVFLSRLDVRRITDPGGTPSISGDQVVTVPPTALPLSVPAQGTTGNLDALDDRLFEAMIAKGPDGTDTLWTAHNIRVDSTGQGSGSGTRDAARWYQLGTLDTTPSLDQSGTLFDLAASTPRFFWMPSIAMNGQGHASLSASTAGTGNVAQIALSGRLADDASGATESPQITSLPTGAYNLGSGTTRRWGDYSQTVVDPTDNQTFWTFQEYANATNSWGVRVIKLQAPPPATPDTANPSTIPLGACSVSVDVTGTSTDGSGFFDPGPDPGGPGYSSHLTASVAGGVAINEVTYTDPTHVTLDLDTRSATSGAQDVTITNPDGQSETATGLVTVDTPASGPSTPCLNGTTPDSPANNNSPKIFGSADAGSTVDLYTTSDCTGTPVGTGTASEFASPGIPVSPVADDSSTTYYATATDTGPVTSACSSTLPTASGSETYIEDSTPPVPSVDGGPTGITNDTTPTFSFSATDAVGPIDFQCSIDTGTPTFSACSGPGNTDTPATLLADGPWVFRARASDGAGNSATATRSFSVVTLHPAPETTITKGPKKKTTKRRPKFKFTSSQAGSTFQCKVDKGQFASCASPFRPPKLRLGKHVLKVRAIGPTGVADPAPAVRKFNVVA